MLSEVRGGPTAPARGSPRVSASTAPERDGSAYECSSLADVGGDVLRAPATASGPPTLPARADARAPVSVQPRLRRVRQDSVSRPGPAKAPDRRAMPRGGG